MFIVKATRGLLGLSHKSLTFTPIHSSLSTKAATLSKSKTELTPEIKAKREKYLAFEREFESKVDYSKLSEGEKQIHTLHKEAIEEFKWTYIDPETGNKVNTRFRKYLLYKCCGNACRHCIYDHKNVPEESKGLKKFNSAFWVPVE